SGPSPFPGPSATSAGWWLLRPVASAHRRGLIGGRPHLTAVIDPCGTGREGERSWLGLIVIEERA
ncbi:MAG: hypothetical protein PV358_11165, partial [Acidimicrobiales bacterium]|nr:hypothetical protein [Acidimicrobiales bacterium]